MKRKKIKGVRAHIKEGAWLNKKDVLPNETNLPLKRLKGRKATKSMKRESMERTQVDTPHYIRI